MFTRRPSVLTETAIAALLLLMMHLAYLHWFSPYGLTPQEALLWHQPDASFLSRMARWGTSLFGDNIPGLRAFPLLLQTLLPLAAAWLAYAMAPALHQTSATRWAFWLTATFPHLAFFGMLLAYHPSRLGLVALLWVAMSTLLALLLTHGGRMLHVCAILILVMNILATLSLTDTTITRHLLARVGHHLPLEKDPTLSMRGWPELGRLTAVQLAKLESGTSIAAPDTATAALLAFHTPGQPQVRLLDDILAHGIPTGQLVLLIDTGGQGPSASVRSAFSQCEFLGKAAVMLDDTTTLRQARYDVCWHAPQYAMR